MGIVFITVDERLIHSRIVEGWIPAIECNRIIVIADGSIRGIEMMKATLPIGVELSLMTVSELIRELHSGLSKDDNIIIVLRQIVDALRLIDGGLNVETINIGVIHQTSNRTQILPFLFLSDDEKSLLDTIAQRGIKIEAQLTPHDTAVNLIENLSSFVR